MASGSTRLALSAPSQQLGSAKGPRAEIAPSNYDRVFRFFPNDLNGAQGRNRTTDTAIFSRMLYQLSYLGTRQTLREPQAIQDARRPIKPRQAHHRQCPAGFHPDPPAAQESGTAPSANGPGPHRHSACCRTVAPPRRPACRIPGSAVRQWRVRWAGARSWCLRSPGAFRQRGVAPHHQGAPSSARKVRHRRAILFQRAYHSGSRAQDRHPAGIG